MDGATISGKKGGLPGAGTVTPAMLGLTASRSVPRVNTAATLWEVSYSPPLDMIVVGTANATTDLANLNAAIAAVAATSTAPKTIGLSGTFHTGSTLPTVSPNITWFGTGNARIVKTGSWAAASGFFSGARCYLRNVTIGWDTGGADGPILDGAGCAGVIFDVTFDSAATHYTALIGTSNGTGGFFQASSQAVTNTPRINTISSTDSFWDLTGSWRSTTWTVSGGKTRVLLGKVDGPITVSGSYGGLAIGEMAGAVTVSGTSVDVSLGYLGAAYTVSGTWVRSSVGILSGTATFSGHDNIADIGFLTKLTNAGRNNKLRIGLLDAGTHDIGLEGTVIFASGARAGTTAYTFQNGSGGAQLNFSNNVNAAITVAATVDHCTLHFECPGQSSAAITFTDGAVGNEVFVRSPTAPVLSGETTYKNSVFWKDSSTASTSLPPRYISVLKPGVLCEHVLPATLVAAGAVMTLNINLGHVPARAKQIDAYILNLGDAETGTGTLTAKLGHGGDADGFVTDATVKAANAISETAGATPRPSVTASTLAIINFTADVNLSNVAGAAAGWLVVLAYQG